MPLRKTLACLSFVLLFTCAGIVARADTFVLQNVSGTMTFEDWPVGENTSRLEVSANDFSASARNFEVPSFVVFNGSVGGNTVTNSFGSSAYMGQSHQYFSWSATFDGVNVTGSIRWVNLSLQTIHTFNFISAGTLTIDTIDNGAIGDSVTRATRYRVTFAGPAATPTPEPATLLLLGTGLAGIGAAARRRRTARGRTP